MYFILDHLTAIVPGAIILMLLSVMHVRNQDDNVDAFQSETNRARMLDLVHVVERDFRNAGSGASGIHAWSSDSATVGAPVMVLDFTTVVDTSQAAGPIRVAYELAVQDSTKINGEMTPLFELKRLAITPSDTLELSRTTPILTSFNVRMLDHSGLQTTDPSAARGLAVQATSISPFGRDRTTRDARWETVIWPVNLRETQQSES